MIELDTSASDCEQNSIEWSIGRISLHELLLCSGRDDLSLPMQVCSQLANVLHTHCNVRTWHLHSLQLLRYFSTTDLLDWPNLSSFDYALFVIPCVILHNAPRWLIATISGHFYLGCQAAKRTQLLTPLFSLARCAWSSLSLQQFACLQGHLSETHGNRCALAFIFYLTVLCLSSFFCVSLLSDQTKAGLTIASEWCGSIMARLAVPGHCVPACLPECFLACIQCSHKP